MVQGWSFVRSGLWTLVEAEVVTGNWEARCGEDDLASAGGSVCNSDKNGKL
jgi:hypothetical protein